ncbi:hypothetical protein SLA2020_339170 [Shorea laevis]
MVDDGVEIGGRGAVADADDSEDLAVGLEVFPGAGRGAAEDELEPEAAGVPGLMRERRLLVLRVERAHRRERDRLVPLQHRPVLRRRLGGTVPIGRTATRIMHEVSMLTSGSILGIGEEGAGFRCGDGRIRSGSFGSTTFDSVTLNKARKRLK